MGDRVTIISSDTHAGGKILDYKPYLEDDGMASSKNGEINTGTLSAISKKAHQKEAPEIETGTKTVEQANNTKMESSLRLSSRTPCPHSSQPPNSTHLNPHQKISKKGWRASEPTHGG